MSSEPKPPAYILDVSVVTAIARADPDVTAFVLGHDARGGVSVVPVLAVTAAALDARSLDAELALHGLERLASSVPVPVQGTGQAIRLAAAATATGMGVWNAHVAAVCIASGCAILTLEPEVWQRHAGGLDTPLPVIELADPEEKG